MNKERDLNRIEVEKLRKVFTNFFDPYADNFLDFGFFDRLSYVGVITEKEAEELTERFEKISDDVWEVLKREDKKLLKDFKNPA